MILRSSYVCKRCSGNAYKYIRRYMVKQLYTFKITCVVWNHFPKSNPVIFIPFNAYHHVDPAVTEHGVLVNRKRKQDDTIREWYVCTWMLAKEFVVYQHVSVLLGLKSQIYFCCYFVSHFVCFPSMPLIVATINYSSQQTLSVIQFSAQNNYQKLVGHLFKTGTLLQTINGFPIRNVQ